MKGNIVANGGDTSVRSGDSVDVTFEWTLDRAPRQIEARLVWFTQGRGTQDVTVLEVQPAMPETTGRQRFRFKVPESPYSFHGRLISLVWAVELVADDLAERWEFQLTPDGREIVLGSVLGVRQ